MVQISLPKFCNLVCSSSARGEMHSDRFEAESEFWIRFGYGFGYGNFEFWIRFLDFGYGDFGYVLDTVLDILDIFLDILDTVLDTA